MDPISSYFTKTKSFSVHILYNAFYRLHVIQLPQMCFTYSQIKQTLEIILDSVDSSEDLDRKEQVMMYSGLFYEACALTKMTPQGAALVFRKGIEENPEKKIAQFVEQTLKERQEKEPEVYESVLQELERQTARLFKEKTPSTPKAVKTEDLPPPTVVPEETPSVNAPVSLNQTHPPAPPGLIETVKASSKDENDEDDNSPSADIADGSIERNESMIKFLAHIRKSGMDIILPQHMHDKLLLTLYIATKVAAPLAHRQLMDMVLAAKQARVLANDLEIVSKTKIRGILALLKNAHSLYTSGGNGESVRLYLGKGVVNYRTFREKHDSFISRCILQQHIFLPIAIKAEVLWTGDEQTITEKCLQLEKLEPILEEYFVIGKTATTNPSRVNSHTSMKRIPSSTTNQSLRSDGSFWGIESLTSAHGGNGVFHSNNSLSPIAFAVANAENNTDLLSLDVSPARSSLVASLGGLAAPGSGVDEKDYNYYNPFNTSFSAPGSSSFAAIDSYHSFRPAFDESILRSPSPDNSLSFASSISDRNSIFVPSNMNLPAASSSSATGRGGMFDFFHRSSNGTNSSFSSHTLSTATTNTTRGSSTTTFDLNSTTNSFSVDGRYSSEIHSPSSNNNNSNNKNNHNKTGYSNTNNNNSHSNSHHKLPQFPK